MSQQVITQIGTTQIAHNGAVGSAVTTGSINTTGATVLVLTISTGATAGANTPTDSNNNQWSFLGNSGAAASGHAEIWIAFQKSAGVALSVGAGHTATFTPSTGSSFATIAFSAFSGSYNGSGIGQIPISPYDAIAGQTQIGTGTGTLSFAQQGGIAAAVGSLVITAVNFETGAAVMSVSAPFTIAAQQTWSGGAIYGHAVAFAVVGPGLLNPSWSSSVPVSVGILMLSLKAADNTIAIDSQVDGGNNGGTTNSLTYNHTINSTNSVTLIVTFTGDLLTGHDDIISVTYAGILMSEISKITSTSTPSTNRFTYAFGLVGAPAGTNAVVITCANNHFLIAVSAAYSGCSLSQVDQVATNVASGTGVASLGVSITPRSDNDWVVVCAECNTGLTAGSGLVSRVQGAAFTEPTLLDSNGPVSPPRAYSPSVNRNSGNTDCIVMIAFGLRPLVTPTIIPPTQLNLAPTLSSSSSSGVNQLFGQFASGPGIMTQAAILSQGISNPAQLSTLVSEALQNVQDQILSMVQVLNTPPELESLVLASADIGTLNVGSSTGPGTFNVYAGPPIYPQIGWIGINPPGVAFPVLTISSILSGVCFVTGLHNLQPNQYVQISGNSNPNCDGTFIVSSVPSTTSFTAVGLYGTGTGGVVQRQAVGAWFQTLAVGGASYADVVLNNNGMYADENGILHIPGAFITGTLAAGTVVTSSLVVSDILIDNLVLTNNSPGAGSVAWSACDLYYKGVHYAITGGNTSSQFITWTVGNTTFGTSNQSAFVPSTTLFLVATNTGGTGDTAWNKVGAGGIGGGHLNLPQLIDGPNGQLAISFTWTNNTPAGEITWSAGQVTYQGITYQVPTGHTSSTFVVYWQLSNPTVLQSSAGVPASLGANDFIVAFNSQNSLGASGVYSPGLEIHNSNGDRTVFEPGLITMFNFNNDITASMSRAAGANNYGTISVADGTGTGSLGSGKKIIATGNDGKVQMATFEVNVANTPGGNVFPNFINSSQGTSPSHSVLAGYLIVNIAGNQQFIQFFN